MPVIAITGDYNVEMQDTVDKFHGKQLLYIGWEDHLMFCAPFALPLSPEMPFRDLLDKVLPDPDVFGYHPEFAKIDWDKTQWFKSNKPWQPDYDASLKDNGLRHKDVIRFCTPGLKGINGSCI